MSGNGSLSDARGPVTMETAAALESAGLHDVARIARKYAVDRPRWWRRTHTVGKDALQGGTPRPQENLGLLHPEEIGRRVRRILDRKPRA